MGPSLWSEIFRWCRKSILKRRQNTHGIWEVRAQHADKAFRLLGFLDKGNLVILTNGFIKKTQKTPPQEIDLAEERKKEYRLIKQFSGIEG